MYYDQDKIVDLSWHHILENSQRHLDNVFSLSDIFSKSFVKTSACVDILYPIKPTGKRFCDFG